MSKLLQNIKSKFPELDISSSGGNAIYVNGIENGVAAPAFLSQLSIVDNTVYLSGQIALDPKTNKMVEIGVVSETHKVFDNIEALLQGVGLGLPDIVKASVFLTNFDQLSQFNEVYLERMKGCKPAREALEVGRLALGATVEITVTAYCSEGWSS